jgi:hypothetical protein
MKDLSFGRVCFSIFTPYPGTEQYDIAKSAGLVAAAPDWSKYSHQSDENHFMKNLTKEEFKVYVDKISQWADRNNIRNADITTLLKKALLNIKPLAKDPRLLIRKVNTLGGIIKNRLSAQAANKGR